MTSFIPQVLQQKLLRYALSRIDLLDVDVLDLDILNIGWRQSTSITLRNVALRKEKLRPILKLPPGLSIVAASVNNVTITVPANLLVSPIKLQLDGVRVSIVLLDNTTQTRRDQTARERNYRGDPESENVKTPQKDTKLPSPEDLAQSFLDQEPADEKAKLEAGLASNSIDLGHSEASIDSEDGSTGYGYGAGFGLPMFLAGVLKGILDRLQFSIEDIVLQVAGSIDMPGLNLPNAYTDTSVSEIGIRVQVALIKSQGTASVDVSRHTTSNDTPSGLAHAHQGQRLLEAQDLKIVLFAVPAAFEQWNRLTEKDEVNRDQASPTHSWTGPSVNDKAHRDDLDISAKGYSRAAPLASRVVSTAIEESGVLPHMSFVPSDSSSVVDTREGTTDTSAIQSEHFDVQESSLGHGRGARTTATAPRNNSSSLRSERRGMFASQFIDEVNQPSTSISLSKYSEGADPSYGSQYHDTPADSMPERASSESLDADEALAESKIFSAKDAESIYMSVMETEGANLQGRELDMPGSWNIDPPEKSGLRQRSSIDLSSRATFNVRKEGPEDPRASPVATSSERERVEADLPSVADSREGPNAYKSLLSINKVDLWLPPAQSRTVTSDDHNADSLQSARDVAPLRTDHNAMPGTFSVIADMQASGTQYGRTSSSINGSKTQSLPKDEEDKQRLTAVEVNVGTVRAEMDLPLCAMAHHFMRRVQDVFKDDSKVVPQLPTENPRSSNSDPEQQTQIGFALEHLSVVLRESVPYLAEKQVPSPVSDTSTKLLNLYASALVSSVVAGGREQLHTLSIGKLGLELAGQDVLHFDKEATLHASMKTSKLVADSALTLSVKQTKNSSDLNVTTLPIHVDLDLLNLDENLATFGGVSGLLQVGSLVLSDTMVSKSPKADMPKPRSVRFDTAIPEATRGDENSVLKMNVRLGGSNLNIKTNGKGISCRSSAIKIVQRQSIIGVQIDQITVSGPQGTNARLAVVDVDNFNMKYLFAPEEQDLSKLIALLAPSKEKFAHDDDFMVDTLLKQRNQGAVARISISTMIVDAPDQVSIHGLQEFQTELSKLSNISKYLPKESRPGLLTLCGISSIEARLASFRGVDRLCLKLEETEVAHVGSPFLVAFACGRMEFSQEPGQIIVHPIIPRDAETQPYMLMARMIGDQFEPSIKVKLFDVCFEYNVKLAIELQRVFSTEGDSPTRLDGSLPFIDALQNPSEKPTNTTTQPPSFSRDFTSMRIDLHLRNCGIGLVPRNLPSKALITLSDATLGGCFQRNQDMEHHIEIKKGTVLLIDDTSNLQPMTEEREAHRKVVPEVPAEHITALCKLGYVSVCWISAAEALVRVRPSQDSQPQIVDIDFSDELFVLESCADSTQTLSELFGNLAPPTAPAQEQQYRTEVAPVSDMMASFTGDAFSVVPPKNRALDDFASDFVDDFEDTDRVNTSSDALKETLYTSTSLTDTSHSNDTMGRLPDVDDSGTQSDEIVGEGLRPTSMPIQAPSGVCKWNSNINKFLPVSTAEVKRSPLTLKVRNMHIIWNLHDGYDWIKTRNKITKAVHDVEVKTEEKRTQRPSAVHSDEGDNSFINDFLFNSIYIGVPANQDPQELARQINKNVDETASETATQTSHDTGRTVTALAPLRRRPRKLRLERSKRQKLTFELQGLTVDFVLFQPGEETISSLVLGIRDLDIFDHVPTSTWRKFATYQHDRGTREDKKPMVQLELCTVKPIPTLTASELVVRVTVLPLRLHIDQDALDFMTRFFEFHDEHGGSSGNDDNNGNSAYLQRVEVRPVLVKLDYKPKKVDYAGLRSGRTKEFMNFFNLDGADIVLKHAIIYGCPSFERLHQSLEDIWMPDIKSTQLPNILSGLNGVRTLVNVGGGFRNLLMIPVQEYQKDGRIIRSVSKGAASFVRTTGSEVTKFGARLAVGAQNMLQGAEGAFTTPDALAEWRTDDLLVEVAQGNEGPEEEERRLHSNYSEQPAGFMQGLKGAARSLERDLLMTRDVIIAVSGEVKESGSMEGAARAVARNAPTLILRPMIGASKAISQTLMGATNTVDPENRRRMNDVSIQPEGQPQLQSKNLLTFRNRNISGIDTGVSGITRYGEFAAEMVSSIARDGG